MTTTADFVIAGAGVIGLTVAREVRQRHAKAKIVVLEKESAIGLHASGRNSGVLHSGIYFSFRPERADVVRESIHPVPDLRFPFLGIHLTRNVSGDVYVGPTAIPALGSENYGLIKGVRCAEVFPIMGHLCKMYFSHDPQFRRLVHHEVAHYFKTRFLAAAQRLVPALRLEDLKASTKIGILPQLVRRKEARMEMDFVVEKTARSIHVLNAISPAFTCAFPFSRFVSEGASA